MNYLLDGYENFTMKEIRMETLKLLQHVAKSRIDQRFPPEYIIDLTGLEAAYTKHHHISIKSSGLNNLDGVFLIQDPSNPGDVIF